MVRFLLACAGAAALLLSFGDPWARSQTPSTLERIVVLDPGHGGNDPGIRSVSGLQEKDLALAVAGRLKEKLEVELGVRVVMTRAGDYDVTPRERAAMANHNKAMLFLSLHLGSSASQMADTFSAFYAEPRLKETGAVPRGGSSFWQVWNEQNSPYRAESRRLAGALQLALSSWLSRESAEPLPGDWLVLKGVGCPAAMVELGCLSNPERSRSYEEKSFVEDLSRTILGGVSSYLEPPHD